MTANKTQGKSSLNKNIRKEDEVDDDSSSTSDFEQLLMESFSKPEKKLRVGEKIKTEVLAVGKERLIVSTGTRVDGFVETSYYKKENGELSLKVGDFVDLYVNEITPTEVNLAPVNTSYSASGRGGSFQSRSRPGNDEAQSSASRFKVGDQVKGTVKRLEAFGAFIEIAPGLEALAHISEISWTRIQSPSDVLKLGQMVEGKILRIEDMGRRSKISVTLKSAASDPWKNLPSHIQVGRVVGGKITKCMPFGAFVTIHAGVEGLIPLSELSSSKRVSRAEEVVNVGDEVSVKVKDINTELKRISLSLKAAQDEVANMSESQDIKDYEATTAARDAQDSQSAIGAKLQAALNKKS